MADKPLPDIGFVADLVIDWFMCLRKPKMMLDSIFLHHSSERGRIKRATSLYLTSFMLSMIAASGVYNGLDFAKGSFVGFYIFMATFNLVGSVSMAFSVYVSTKLFRISIAFDRVFVTLTVFASGYMPILQVLTAPGLSSLLAEFKKAKGNELGLVETLLLDPEKIRGIVVNLPGIQLLAGSGLGLLLVLIQLAMAMDVLAQQTTAERYRIFNAGACGLLISVIPAIALAGLYAQMLYAYTPKA